MKKLSLLITFIIGFSFYSSALDYYWVGDGGNWSDFATHWATTSGGAVFHSQAPTENDDVFFDANSFTIALQTVNIDVFDARCHDIDWTGVTNSPVLDGFNSLSVYGSLTFVPGMICNMSGSLQFYSTDSLAYLDFGGSTLPNMMMISFTSTTVTWHLLSDITMIFANSMMMFNDGSLVTNDHNINIFNINVMGAATGKWTLGNSTVNCSQLSFMGGGMTFSLDAGTSTINIINGNSNFMGQGFTFHNLNFNSLMFGDELWIVGANTFDTLTFTNIGKVYFPAGETNTIEDIQFNGSCDDLVMITSSSDAFTAYINKVSDTLAQDYLVLKDITGTGGAVFISDNSSSLGNVNNWIINASPSTTYYWIGNDGLWNDPLNWSLSSGGAPSGLCMPNPSDDVVFDANSFSAPGQAVAVDGNAFCHDMLWSGVVNFPDIKQNSFSDNIYISGSMVFDPNMTASFNGNYYFVSNDTAEEIDTKNIPLAGSVYINGDGVWTFMDHFQTMYLTFNKGSINTNDKNVNLYSFNSNTNLSRKIELGASVVTITSNWQIPDSTGLILLPGTSVVNFTSYGYFDGGYQSYNNVNFASGATIFQNNTFYDLGFTAGNYYSFGANTTQTITNDLIASGTCASYIKLQSYTQGTKATLSKSSGVINVDRCIMKDMNAAGGATFNATNSIDLSNNSGWNFTPPAANTYYWVGGTGNWSDPNHWSLVSGGAPDACIPAFTDNVVFDGLSGLAGKTVTVNAESGCNNFTWAFGGGALSGNTYNLYVGGNLSLNAGMNMSFGSFNNYLIFNSNVAGKTINTAGKIIQSNIRFDGNGSWSLSNNLVSNRSIYLNKGSLNANNRNISCNKFYSSTSETRNFTLGNGTHTISGDWYVMDGTNLNIVPGASTINFAGTNFYGGDQDYNNVNLTNGGYLYIYDNNIFNNINIPSSKNLNLGGGDTLTFYNFSMTSGVNCTNFNSISTTIPGTPAVFSAEGPSPAFDYMIIKDVAALGSMPMTANNSIGLGDVTGWVLTPYAGATHYWVGGTGNWTDISHWSASSGGPGGLCVPTAYDDVVFDSNSFVADDTVSFLGDVFCKSMDWSGVTQTPHFSMIGPLTVNGSLTFIPNMVIEGSPFIYLVSNQPANTITAAGNSLNILYFNGSGEYNLTDDLKFTFLNFNAGTLNTNNYSLIGEGSSNFSSSSISPRTLNLGNSDVVIAVWDIPDSTGLTLNAGNSNITSKDSWYFNGGGLVYNNVTFDNSDLFISLVVYGSSTFDSLIIAENTEVYFDTNSTQYVSQLITQATVPGRIRLSSNVWGYQAFIVQSDTVFSGDYLDIRSMNVSGTDFYACSNSIDEGNNTGWTFFDSDVDLGLVTEFCAGDTLVLDAGTGTAYSWSTGQTTRKINVVSGGTYSVTAYGGCCIASGSIDISMNPLPSVDLGPDQDICSGDSYIADAGAGHASYLWSSGDTTQTINITVEDNYVVTVTDAKGCTSSDTIYVTVNPNLPVSATISALPAGAVCSGTNVEFAVNPVNEGLSPVYQWKKNGLDVGAGDTTYNDAGLLNGDIISCLVTSSETCTSGNPAMSDTITMVVNPILPVSVSVTSSDDSICAGTSVTFDAVPVNGGTIPSYQWYLNSAPVGGDSAKYITSGLNDSDTVYCVLTSNEVCTSGNPAASNTISTTVFPVNVADVSISTFSADICLGSSATFTALPVHEGSTPSYQWYQNGAPVGTDSIAYQTAAIADGDYFYCVMLSSELCITGSPATSDTIIMNVADSLPVSVTVTASDYNICDGSGVIFTANPVNGGAGASYQWYLNGVAAGTDSVKYTNGSLSDLDEVYCQLTSSEVCATGNPAISDTVTITVYLLPAAAVLTSGGDSIFSSIILGNQWYYYPDSLIAGETGDVLLPTLTGDYYVIVTDSNGCISDTSNIINFVYVFTSFEDIGSGVTVYPNPATKELIISTNRTFEHVIIRLININGQLMIAEEDINGRKYTLNVDALPPACYFLEVIDSKQVSRFKIIKN